MNGLYEPAFVQSLFIEQLTLGSVSKVKAAVNLFIQALITEFSIKEKDRDFFNRYLQKVEYLEKLDREDPKHLGIKKRLFFESSLHELKGFFNKLEGFLNEINKLENKEDKKVLKNLKNNFVNALYRCIPINESILEGLKTYKEDYPVYGLKNLPLVPVSLPKAWKLETDLLELKVRNTRPEHFPEKDNLLVLYVNSAASEQGTREPAPHTLGLQNEFRFYRNIIQVEFYSRRSMFEELGGFDPLDLLKLSEAPGPSVPSGPSAPSEGPKLSEAPGPSVPSEGPKLSEAPGPSVPSEGPKLSVSPELSVPEQLNIQCKLVLWAVYNAIMAIGSEDSIEDKGVHMLEMSGMEFDNIRGRQFPLTEFGLFRFAVLMGPYC